MNKCSVDGCNKSCKCKGLCLGHYDQLRITGRTSLRLKNDPNEIIVENNIARMILYNRQNEEISETIFDNKFINEVSQLRWSLKDNGYVSHTYRNSNDKQFSITLHRFLMNIIDPENPNSYEDIDHKDTNKLNNLEQNLRRCTRSSNRQNSNISSRNTSGSKGVTFLQKKNLWRAQIKNITLGDFHTKEEATDSYNKAAIKYFGEFALLNTTKTLTEKDMIYKIFNKQDELNIHTNGSNWKSMDIPWYRAIFIECSEMMDYLPWKWWKGGKLDLEQLKLELIDILHFGVSDILTNDKHMDIKINHILNAFKYYEVDNIQLEEMIELLVKHTLETKHFGITMFVKLCKKVGLSIEKIYKLYMGKNILNKFRQNNGYKQQTYIKIWNGKEDNVYLLKFLDEIKEIKDDFEQVICGKLQEKYKEVINNSIE